MKWQPIETAPRNGEEFQAWCVLEAEGRRSRKLHPEGWWESKCKFDPESENFLFWDRVDYDHYDWDFYPYIIPTHWMPQPKQPDQNDKCSNCGELEKQAEIEADYFQKELEVEFDHGYYRAMADHSAKWKELTDQLESKFMELKNEIQKVKLSRNIQMDKLIEDLVRETERAMASHGGSHDTCFEQILKEHFGDFNG